MPGLVWTAWLGLIGLCPTASAFFFYWTTNTAQCGTYWLSWRNGTAPFRAMIIPIYGKPFFYDIPSDAYSDNWGQYPINLQLAAGTSYVVIMSDATGTGTGGSSQIVRVGVSNMTDCLYTAYQNSTALDFTFTVSGVAEQCEKGFELGWSSQKQYSPYNFTIIPLDQSFQPYDVSLENGKSSMSDWTLNMTTGTRFTVMMNDALGYGRGGVAGIYEVASGGSDDCVVQSLSPTGTWPLGLATNTIPPATLPVTDRAGGKGLDGGAIAGVVIGVIAFFVVLGAVLFCLIRRKRRRQAQEAKLADYQLDLGEEPVERTRSRAISHTSLNLAYHRLDPFVEGRYEVSEGSGDDTVTSAGFAGLGAGLPVPPAEAFSTGRTTVDEIDRPSGPGVAGPLPTKAPIASASATAPAPTHPLRPSTSASSNNLKNDLLSQTRSSASRLPAPLAAPSAQNPNTGRSMRVVNHDDPASLPAVPPGARYDERRLRSAGPTYRRHEDAGRVPLSRRDPEDIVDLPPLYTDVPRDEPEYTPLSSDASPTTETSPRDR